jgi:hypothetical protein
MMKLDNHRTLQHRIHELFFEQNSCHAKLQVAVGCTSFAKKNRDRKKSRKNREKIAKKSRKNREKIAKKSRKNREKNAKKSRKMAIAAQKER